MSNELVVLVISPTKSISRSQTPKLSTNINMPIPTNGNMYTAIQAMDWMSVAKHELSIAKGVQMMIHRNYFPAICSTLYDVYKNAR